MEGFARCFQPRRLTFLLPRRRRLSSVVAVTHATRDGAEACGAHPWCAGTCAACLGVVTHAAHDGVSVSAHATCDGAASRHASLGAQGRVPHARRASLGRMDIRCMSVHVPAHQGCVPGRVGRPGPPGRAACRLDLRGMCRQRRAGAHGGGRGTWGSARVC